MSKTVLSAVALSAVLAAGSALADEAKIEAGASVNSGASTAHDVEANAGTSTTETKVKKKKNKTTVKSTTEHSGESVKSKVHDHGDAAAVEAEAGAKVTTDD